MEKYNAKDLISKYNEGTATPEERMLVESGFLKELENSAHTPSQERIELADKRIAAKLMAYIGNTQAKTVRLWPRIAVAASILVFFSVGLYFYVNKIKNSPLSVQHSQHDIAPGSNKAILTLANGKTIILTGAKNGQLAIQGNMAVTKKADGEVAYSKQSDPDSYRNENPIRQKADEIEYNTMTTPRGGKYDLTLADGTKVWLDAASSITYPVAFTGHDRSVQITGQVYFEVTHNAAKPFSVSVNGETVEVLGTHFNINAYGDEPVMKTTLLEGSIKVSKNGKTALLKPGQQSIIQSNSNSITVRDVDTEEATAWKNGYFLFDNESLESVMRKVSRWYDVDIQYPADQKVKETYGGSITRYSNVSKVLDMLEITGHVKFEIEGKKIIVQNK